MVNLPTEEEEADRALVSQMIYLKKTRTSHINRLHSVYHKAGIVDLTKKDLKTEKNRRECMSMMSGTIYAAEIEQLEKMILNVEESIAELDEKKREALNRNEYAEVLLSIPGVGPEFAITFFAYVGDGSRFSHASQVSNYAGLVPRVDISGDSKRYGNITKRGCTQIRRVAVQAAWALVSSK